MGTKLNRLIRKQNIKFFFRIESIADLNTTIGFIQVLGIHKKYAVVSFGSEVTGEIVKNALRGCSFPASRRLRKNWHPVTFDTDGHTRLAGDGHLIITYDPFKYCVPVRFVSREKVSLRRSMKITRNRKVIVASCSTRDEIDAIIFAYENLNLAKKPLLILGLRKTDRRLENYLTRRDMKVYERCFVHQPLSLLGRSDVVVLNTMGELSTFLRVADLAIMGYERNLFEPAQLGIPMLYFDRPLNINKSEREMARLFKLYWRKNRTAKRLLDKFGGAAPIKLNVFSRKINQILNRPEPMIWGARRAVQEFYHQFVPKIRSRTTRILEHGIMRFNRNLN